MRDLNHRYVLNADIPHRDPHRDFISVPHRLVTAKGVPPRAIALYAVLDTFTNDRFARPSISELARRLDCSPGACRTALTWLVRKGWVYRYDHLSPDGGRETPLYVVNVEQFEDLSKEADRWVRINCGTQEQVQGQVTA